MARSLSDGLRGRGVRRQRGAKPWPPAHGRAALRSSSRDRLRSGAVGDGAHATHEHILVDTLPQRAALLAQLLISS